MANAARGNGKVADPSCIAKSGGQKSGKSVIQCYSRGRPQMLKVVFSSFAIKTTKIILFKYKEVLGRTSCA
jgi:hypothetical protein